MLIQKETSQILGGASLRSETYCTSHSNINGNVYTESVIDRDYDDGSTQSFAETDC